MKWTDLVGRTTELGFTPQAQVRWLSPGELWRAGIKVALSSVFASFADRREVQAALPAKAMVVRGGADSDLWFDFVADLGDGFDSTYSVAWLIGQLGLRLPGLDAEQGPDLLPRGEFLVMGGDEVYPTSSTTGYEDRTKGPYRAALAAGNRGLGATPGPRPDPLLLALPGNHDWYDGLTAFLRVFAQQRALGGWRTEQTRSYFAVELPHRWWLVGLDTQLGSYLDGPQISYFREHLSARLRPGDGVIVCVAAPTWLHTAEGEPDAFNTFHFFERDVVRRCQLPDGSWRETGAQVRLWLTGDRHHYNRYQETSEPQTEQPAARQLVTCGLGGAYLSSCGDLPNRLRLPPDESRIGDRVDPGDFGLVAAWPPRAESRRLESGLLALTANGLPFRNPGLWPTLGLVQCALVLGALDLLGQQMYLSPMDVLRFAPVAEALQLAGQAAAWFAILTAAAWAWTLWRTRSWRVGPPDPLLAVALQIAVTALLTVGLVSIDWPLFWPDWVVLVGALGLVFAVGGLVSSYALAVYIFSSGNKTVRSWQLSAQSIEDRKGFLRFQLKSNGELVMYPIVVDTVCRDWQLVANVDDGHSVPVPTGDQLRPRLVEAPVRIART
jgi:hypothetical protein